MSTMNTSDDEYEGYNLAEFTEEDFASIDAGILLRGLNNQSWAKAGPAVAIEIERVNEDVAAKASEGQPSASTSSFRSLLPRDTRSPFERHRYWNRILSVTDLVSPAWCVLHFVLTRDKLRSCLSRCEMQYDYGLRGLRSRKLERRPASFTSGEGKIIHVEKKVAAENDQTVKRGKVRRFSTFVSIRHYSISRTC